MNFGPLLKGTREVYKPHEREKTMSVSTVTATMTIRDVQRQETSLHSRTLAQFRIDTDKVYDGITYRVSSRGKCIHHTCAAALVITRFGTYSSSVTQKRQAIMR
jgi:hypothetical protein